MTDDQYTGGMLALIPDDPDALAIDGGHPPEQLHLTLLYLGDDVTGWAPEQAARLRELIEASAPAFEPIEARVMGRATFNLDGGPDGDRDPCTVYLVGDAPTLSPIRDWARWVLTSQDEHQTPPEQHDPFVPHVTVADGTDDSGLSYAGPITFGAIRLALAGERYDFPLGVEPDAEPADTSETKKLTFTPPADVREVAAGLRGATAHQVYEGKALDGAGVAWVAQHCGEPGQRWAAAMQRRAENKELSPRRREADDEDHDEPEPGEDDLLRMPPFDDEELPRPRKRRRFADRAVRESPGALAPEGLDSTGDSKGLDEAMAIEIKVMSPDPRAAKLRSYWAHGKGRKKWANSPHPFRALRRHLAKYVHSPRVLNGLTANIFKLGKGVYPGQRPHGGRKSIDWDAVEVKMADLDHVGEAELCDGVDDWGHVFADEDLSGFSAEDLDDGDDSDQVEGKGADRDLLEISRRALIGQNLMVDGEDDTDEEQESWEEIVSRDDVWQMGADGVMRCMNGDGGQGDMAFAVAGPGAWRA